MENNKCYGSSIRLSFHTTVIYLNFKLYFVHVYSRTNTCRDIIPLIELLKNAEHYPSYLGIIIFIDHHRQVVL